MNKEMHLCFSGVSGAKFTVEELFAMILENAKQTAEAFAGASNLRFASF